MTYWQRAIKKVRAQVERVRKKLPEGEDVPEAQWAEIDRWIFVEQFALACRQLELEREQLNSLDSIK